jgi:hypothetical protein
MIAFAPMLIGPAQEAGMKVPEDAENFVAKDFPHFAVFLGVQLGSPMPNPTSHWSNARVVSAIPDDKIKIVTFNDLVELGLEIGYPLP